ncbi:unnamed protein product [Prunus armeniaca]|uniref:Uncharacterized protein n=1 Tax=Prunus armeniaca TaxID=36596 RepID=A0A6J5V4T0_PRUAR|nr:unnamed protein product [Prunus armeniaca]
MDLLRAYSDQNDEKLNEPEQQNQNPSSTTLSLYTSPPWLLLAKSAVPNVDDTMLALKVVAGQRSLSRPIDPTQHIVGFNSTYDQLWAPIYGPSYPYTKDGIARACATTSSTSLRTPLLNLSSSMSSAILFTSMAMRATQQPLLGIIMLVILRPCRRTNTSRR